MATKHKKVMYTVEVPIKCSPNILYEYLATPLGLQEWFADKVDQRDSNFYFNWSGSVDAAEVLGSEENQYIRFRWNYYDEDEFFEFRISRSPVTNETILQITDFAEKGDVDDQELLWQSQVSDLKHRLGC